MTIYEEAVTYAIQAHSGETRKVTGLPYFFHPLEAAQIAATMTEDEDVLVAAILHDVAEHPTTKAGPAAGASTEDTAAACESAAAATLDDIRSRFGERVAFLVSSVTESRNAARDKGLTWKQRKEESIKMLMNSEDLGVKILWLADKLSNIRSIGVSYNEKGNAIWNDFNQKDPEMLRWYYRTIAVDLEMYLNKTGAYKAFVRQINAIWPGTLPTEKERFKKYREYSVDGCKVIGKGAKGTVYRYDDELIIKVYNEKNTYQDIERENLLARQAFVSGIPTAISFGIVSVGKQFGSMFELLNSNTVSQLVALHPENVDFYAEQMADLARKIHSTEAVGITLPDFTKEVYGWIEGGIAHEDRALTAQVQALVDALPPVKTMIHGDFHAGNVMIQNGEPILIDMDRLSTCHPIIELSGVYMFYVGFGELDPSMIENFMGFSYDTAKEFYRAFMARYFREEGEAVIESVTRKCALLTYVRLVRRVYKKGTDLSAENAAARDYYMSQIRELLPQVSNLELK